MKNLFKPRNKNLIKTRITKRNYFKGTGLKNSLFPKNFKYINDDILRNKVSNLNTLNLNDTNIFGMTHFHKICLNQQLCVNSIKESFSQNADPNFKSVHGSTPFQEVCKNPNLQYDIVREFFKRDADPNIQDNDGMSAFHNYCCTPNPDEHIIQLFLENGADPNLPNNEGSTPFNFICENKNIDQDIIKLFLNYDSDIHARDDYHRSPLLNLLNNFGEEKMNSIIEARDD
eukprot:TRINITY_DN3860_c0_g2_i1.p1 TRINITY_DN3860_c0_g2~~TRINITY_DN3860_c0_g2_i1.p1  ORF type:complete len:230 (+),score=75.57 TRINITY_DN3860_c0_g2_i1:36-725(+)